MKVFINGPTNFYPISNLISYINEWIRSLIRVHYSIARLYLCAENQQLIHAFHTYINKFWLTTALMEGHNVKSRQKGALFWNLEHWIYLLFLTDQGLQIVLMIFNWTVFENNHRSHQYLLLNLEYHFYFVLVITKSNSCGKGQFFKIMSDSDQLFLFKLIE